jgi:hypothetical protein
MNEYELDKHKFSLEVYDSAGRHGFDNELRYEVDGIGFDALIKTIEIILRHEKPKKDHLTFVIEDMGIIDNEPKN